MSEPVYKRCHCKGEDGKELGPKCDKLKRKDGSWNPRHGTWYYALELPLGMNGKRQPRLRRGGFDTRDEAQGAHDAAKAKLRRRGDPSSRVTTGDYLERWLKGAKQLKKTTRRNYGLIIGTYLRPLIGHIELGRLSTGDIEDMFGTIDEWNALLAAGQPVRIYQRHVGEAAKMRIKACLRVALNYAVDTQILSVNPADRKKVRLESPEDWKPLAWTAPREEKFWREYRTLAAASTSGRQDREFTAWRTMRLRPVPSMVWLPGEGGHAARFLEYAYGHGEPLAPMFELIMLTAMRRGETCGLTWPHVDWEGGEILAGPERVQVGWAVEESGGKTESSLRHLAVEKRELDLLRAVKAAQAAERLRWGSDYQETDLVFTLEDGTPVHPAHVTASFVRIAFAAGLPPVRVHDLRHGWASYALAAGVDISVIQARLGHSSSKLTRDTYTTVLSDLARTAAKTVSDMIPERRTDPGPGPGDPIRTPRALRAVESS